jgi:hypothetical protein
MWQYIHFECINTASVAPTSGASLAFNVLKTVPGHDNPNDTTEGSHTQYFGTVSGSTRINSCSFWGFYDNVVMTNAMEWWFTDNFVSAQVRYGLFVNNASLPDGGDGKVRGNNFYPELRDCRAAIYQVASGGLLIEGTKSNGRAYYKMDWFYDASIDPTTSVLQVQGANSCENMRYGGIRVRSSVNNGKGFSLIQLHGIEFAAYSPNLTNYIDIAGCSTIQSGGHVFKTQSSTQSGFNTRIDLCNIVTLTPSTVEAGTTPDNQPKNSLTNCTNVRDFDLATPGGSGGGNGGPTAPSGEQTFGSDNFSASGARYADASQGTGTTDRTNGLTLTPRTGGETNLARLISNYTYAFTSKRLACYGLVPLVNNNANNVTNFFMGGATAASATSARFAIQGGTLYMQYGDNHGNGFKAVAYDSSAHANLAFRVSGGNVLFETSADGNTWTQQHTLPVDVVDVDSGNFGWSAQNASASASLNATVAAVSLLTA